MCIRDSLPSTMTDLYTKMMLNIILHNIKKWFPEYEGIKSIPGFNSLPEPLLPSWWHLCEFAFQTLASDRLIFSQEQLSDFFPKDSAFDPKIFGFGLLQQSDSVLDVGLAFISFTSPFRSSLQLCTFQGRLQIYSLQLVKQLLHYLC